MQVRGYVVNGYSPGQQRIDVHQIGYADYYNGQIYQQLGDQYKINMFFYMLIVSSAFVSISLLLCCGPCLLYPFCEKHFDSCPCCNCNGDASDPENVSNSENDKWKSSLFLACVVISNLLGIYALIIDIIHIHNELTRDKYNKHYIAWACLIPIVFVLDCVVQICTCICQCYKCSEKHGYKNDDDSERMSLVDHKRPSCWYKLHSCLDKLPYCGKFMNDIKILFCGNSKRMLKTHLIRSVDSMCAVQFGVYLHCI